jgi:hypothetical protein
MNRTTALCAGALGSVADPVCRRDKHDLRAECAALPDADWGITVEEAPVVEE